MTERYGGANAAKTRHSRLRMRKWRKTLFGPLVPPVLTVLDQISYVTISDQYLSEVRNLERGGEIRGEKYAVQDDLFRDE